MRKTLLLTVLSLTSLVTTAAPADDGLFSKIRLNSTSSSTAPSGQPARQQPQTRPLSGASELQSTLLAAGYTARVNENNTISMELSRSDWTARVLLAVADEGRQLRMAMRLTEPEANTVIAPKTLRGMLQANRSNWGAFFAIAGDPQHIELVKTMPNQGLDSDRLRTELEKLADMAEKTKEIWNAEGVRIRQASKTETEPETTTTPANPSTTPATTTPAKTQVETPAAPSLTGKWIATPTTNEAFALQIEASSSFRLVHVKGTNSTKSQGTWTMSGTTLSLKGDDGTTISGSVTRQQDSFTLTIAAAGGKSTSITFKSSK